MARMSRNKASKAGSAGAGLTQNPFGVLAGLGDLPAGPGEPQDGAPDTPAQASHRGQKNPNRGRVDIVRQTAHRGGKTVIVIKDFATHLPVSVIENVAKRVRSACGCGGTVKDKRIEIQGDNVAKIRAVLEAEGFEVAGVK